MLKDDATTRQNVWPLSFRCNSGQPSSLMPGTHYAVACAFKLVMSRGRALFTVR